jgi:ESS family glutamate:Na+ symporter
MAAFMALCMLLLIGHWLRTHLRVLQWLYLPACVVAGLVGLALVGSLESLYNCVLTTQPLEPQPWREWVIDAQLEIETWTSAWSDLPGFLINVVFACLFMGVTLPKLSSLLRRGGIQLAYGQVVAWGQYVVGVGLVLAVLGGAYGVSDVFGGILPVGFEGGHGTAAGLAKTFDKIGWPEGKDFALASATGGIVSAIVVGMVLVNVATRLGWTARRLGPAGVPGDKVHARTPADVPEDDSIGIIPVDRRPSAGKLTVKADAIESFTLHVAMVAVAMMIGFALKHAVAQLDRLYTMPGEFSAGKGLFSSIPAFPLCMVGGLVVQVWEQKFDRHKIIDLGLVRRIQNSALDFLVAAAIATISLDVIVTGMAPLLILMAAGIAWNVFCVLALARRLLPDAWFERAIVELGQSMGVTATGLLLLRVVDPDYETPAAAAFATKQLMHEPIMGGGLWTSIAIPLLADPNWGGRKVWLISAAAVTFWMIVLIVARVRRGRAVNS